VKLVPLTTKLLPANMTAEPLLPWMLQSVITSPDRAAANTTPSGPTFPVMVTLWSAAEAVGPTYRAEPCVPLLPDRVMLVSMAGSVKAPVASIWTLIAEPLQPLMTKFDSWAPPDLQVWYSRQKGATVMMVSVAGCMTRYVGPSGRSSS
jgi:hypothetical protein